MAGLEFYDESEGVNYPPELLHTLYADLTTDRLINIISFSNILYNKIIAPNLAKGVNEVYKTVMATEPIESFCHYLKLKIGDRWYYVFMSLQGVISNNTFQNTHEADLTEAGFAALELHPTPDIFQAIAKVRWRQQYVDRVVNEKIYNWNSEKAERYVLGVKDELNDYCTNKESKVAELHERIKKKYQTIKEYNEKSKTEYAYSTESFFSHGVFKPDADDLNYFFFLAESRTGGWEQCETVFLELNNYFNLHQEIFYSKKIIESLEAPDLSASEANRKEALTLINEPDIMIPLFLSIEKCATNGTGKFATEIRCAAFCELLRLNSYIKANENEPNKMIIRFAELRYGKDIRTSLAPGKAKREQRASHQNQHKKGMSPLKYCFKK